MKTSRYSSVQYGLSENNFDKITKFSAVNKKKEKYAEF